MGSPHGYSGRGAKIRKESVRLVSVPVFSTINRFGSVRVGNLVFPVRRGSAFVVRGSVRFGSVCFRVRFRQVAELNGWVRFGRFGSVSCFFLPDIHTCRQAGRQAGIHIYRQTDGQTYIHTYVRRSTRTTRCFPQVGSPARRSREPRSAAHLYSTPLYSTLLYYNILHYTILYYTILHYTILYDTIPYYTIMGAPASPPKIFDGPRMIFE